MREILAYIVLGLIVAFGTGLMAYLWFTGPDGPFS